MQALALRVTATRPASRDPLLRFAEDPEDPVTLAFAAAIELARSSLCLPGGAAFGLPAEEFSALLKRYFPGADAVYRHSAAPGQVTRDEEFDDLVKLLVAYGLDARSEVRWLAYAIAACSMGEDHLWQDMGLPNRQALSDLIATWFPILHRRNTANMRWKKFFYKQLCDQQGVRVCRSPSCAVCVDYANCFGSEDEESWQGRGSR